jgi:serine/threonine protein kinase
MLKPGIKKFDFVKDEATILRRLYSKYVVKTYEIFETKKEILIVMEYMKCSSMDKHLQKLSDWDIWRFFRNLICAVEHCKVTI